MKSYKNKSNEELKKLFSKQLEYYKKKKNIKSYTFTTNYGVHPKTGAIAYELFNNRKSLEKLLFWKKTYKVINDYYKNYNAPYRLSSMEGMDINDVTDNIFPSNEWLESLLGK